jgi:hypothetical protein
LRRSKRLAAPRSYFGAETLHNRHFPATTAWRGVCAGSR